FKCKWFWLLYFQNDTFLSLQVFKNENPLSPKVIRESVCYNIYPLINANTKNILAVITVPRCKTKSIPRAFCLPNNCSAPPEIAPESPALLPDCNTINTIVIIESITNKLFKTVSIQIHTLTKTNII